MKALCWHGTGDVRIDNVPEPKIVDAGDAIVRVTSTAICGSNLHLFDGFMPTMRAGEIDPSFAITHRPKLHDGSAAYKTFRDKQDGCIKVVLKPWA